MKRLLSLILIAVLLLSLTACQTDPSGVPATDNPNKQTEIPTATPDIDGDDYIPDEEFTQTQLDEAKYWVDYRNQGKSFTLAKAVVAGDTSIPEGDTVNDNAWLRYFETRNGVKPEVVWWASGDAYDQKVSMAIASGDTPDYLEVNLNQFRMLAKSGMLADLTEYYNSMIPEVKRNPFKEADDKPLEAVTFNGQILGYPSMQPGGDSGSLVWLRTDWLDKLNLSEPTTYEDVGKIAKAFKENDPDGNGSNDTTGMIINSKSYAASYADVGNTGEIFVNFNAFPNMWMTDENGTVEYGSIVPGALDCLKMLNQWYKDGAIHQEFTSLGDDIFQPVAANQCGIFLAPWWASWNLADSIVNDPSAQWKSYGITRDDGNFYVGMVDPAVTIAVISAKAEDPEMIWRLMVIGRPEATIRSVVERDTILAAAQEALDSGLAHSYQPFRVIVSNTIYAVENNYDRIWGIKNGTMTWDDVKQYYDDNGLTYSDTDYDVSVVKYGLDVLARENPYEEIGEWSNGFGYFTGIEPMAKDNCVRQYNDFIGVTETMETKKAYLDKLEVETYTKMILGETDGKSLDDFFNGFVVEWKAQGGEQITKEVQETLDDNK